MILLELLFSLHTCTEILVENKTPHILFVCLVRFFTSQSTARVMSGQSIHLTTLFSWASLTKRLTSTLCTYLRLLLTKTLPESAEREENGHRNYFMINLHESMGPDRERLTILVLV